MKKHLGAITLARNLRLGWPAFKTIHITVMTVSLFSIRTIYPLLETIFRFLCESENFFITFEVISL